MSPNTVLPARSYPGLSADMQHSADAALWLQPCRSYERRGRKAAAFGSHLLLMVVVVPVSSGHQLLSVHSGAACFILPAAAVRPTTAVLLVVTRALPAVQHTPVLPVFTGHRPQSAFHSHSSYHVTAASVTAKVCCMVWLLTLSSTWRLAWIAIIESTHPPLPALLQHAVTD